MCFYDEKIKLDFLKPDSFYQVFFRVKNQYFFRIFAENL